MEIQELEVIYTKDVTDFYSTAKVAYFDNTHKVLVGYNGIIAYINGMRAVLVKYNLDDMELAAFREFLRQGNFEVGGIRIRDLKRKYGVN